MEGNTKSPPKVGDLNESGDDGSLLTDSSINADAPATLTEANLICPLCSREYKSRRGLQKHVKGCGTRDRTWCEFCDRTFDHFQAVRCHEKRAHPEQFQSTSEDKLKVSEAELLEKIAEVEANKKGCYFVKDIMEATRLTKDQVRHKREKPLYQEYLRIAKENKLAKNPFMMAPYMI